MEEIGWADTYDYVYMPQDRKSGACKGYAFLNFYRPEHADSFPNMIHKTSSVQASWVKKKLVVTPARCQGVLRNLEQMVSLGLEVPDGSVFNKPWVRVGNEMKPLAAPAAARTHAQFASHASFEQHNTLCSVCLQSKTLQPIIHHNT